MTELPNIKDVISAMLKENTGTHFLDSGGSNGRQWQRNQLVDFEKTPASTVEFDLERRWVTVTKSIYFYLIDQLIITEESQSLYERFEAFTKLPDIQNLSWHETYDAFAKHLNAVDYPDGLDKNDSGWKIIGGENSYNHESSLSQVYQYDILDNDDKGIRIIVLQIHGGADVRGGYTDPKFFQTSSGEEYFGYADNDYTIDIGRHSFYTDDGNNWYSQGGGKNDIIEMVKQSVMNGYVTDIEPDETCFKLVSEYLNSISIEYHHRSDNCRTLDEFIEV
jgi:hypothetical protein